MGSQKSSEFNWVKNSIWLDDWTRIIEPRTDWRAAAGPTRTAPPEVAGCFSAPRAQLRHALVGPNWAHGKRATKPRTEPGRAPAAAPGTAEPLPSIVRGWGSHQVRQRWTPEGDRGLWGTDLALGREGRRFQRSQDGDDSPEHGGQWPDSQDGEAGEAPRRSRAGGGALRAGALPGPGAGSPCGQGEVLLPAVILVLAVLPINTISACHLSSSACHAALKQDPVLPFAPSPVFSSFKTMTIITPMLVPRSSFRVKAITRSAASLSFLTAARCPLFVSDAL